MGKYYNKYKIRAADRQLALKIGRKRLASVGQRVQMGGYWWKVILILKFLVSKHLTGLEKLGYERKISN